MCKYHPNCNNQVPKKEDKKTRRDEDLTDTPSTDV